MGLRAVTLVLFSAGDLEAYATVLEQLLEPR